MPRPADHEGYVSPTELTDADLGRCSDPCGDRAAAAGRAAAAAESSSSSTRSTGTAATEALGRARSASATLYWRVRGRVGRVVKRRR